MLRAESHHSLECTSTEEFNVPAPLSMLSQQRKQATGNEGGSLIRYDRAVVLPNNLVRDDRVAVLPNNLVVWGSICPEQLIHTAVV
jgi:hypothetical protein